MRIFLPALRQPATCSLIRDGALIAYGSHHLNHDDRPAAMAEAFRTLRAGGRLVLRDFETGGGTARWFDRVVHPWSPTGHPHRHFSRREMFTLLTAAGFRDVRVMDIDDLVGAGDTPARLARTALVAIGTRSMLSGEGD